MLWTITEVAEFKGVSRQSVYNAIKRGSLIRDTSGKIDDSISQNAYWMNKRPGGGARKQRLRHQRANAYRRY